MSLNDAHDYAGKWELTMITKSQLDHIRATYGFDEITVDKYFEGYGSKFVALLHTNEGKYVFKGMYHHARNVFTVFEYLQQQKYPHISHIRNALDGSSHCDLDGVLCYLYEYIHQESERNVTDRYFEIGEALGKLHSIKVKQCLPAWDLNALITDIKNDRIPNVPPLDQPLLKGCLEHFDRLYSLPKAIIHGDVADNNSVTDARNGNLLLIDWDGCGIAPRIIDLGYPLFNLLSADLQFHWDAAQALVTAYTRHIELTNDEKNCFLHSILLLPFNHILFGDTQSKIRQIQWFLQMESQINALLK